VDKGTLRFNLKGALFETQQIWTSNFPR